MTIVYGDTGVGCAHFQGPDALEPLTEFLNQEAL